MDDLWGNLEPVTGAASKRPGNLHDAPTKQPMKAGIKPAQQKSPNGDQKKHRRQMGKKASGTVCPQCGTAGDIVEHGDHYQCNHCGFEFTGDGAEWTNPGLSPHPDHVSHLTSSNQQDTSSATKESTMTTSPNGQPTEADLLTRMAAATTLTEQAALAAQLEDLRAAKREAALNEGSLDWGAMDAPAPAHGLSTFAALAPQVEHTPTYPGLASESFTEHIATQRLSGDSDWLMLEEPAPVEDNLLTAQMRAQASLWFENEVWGPVKDSRQEFSVQAHNAASRAATAYSSTQRTAAQSVFLAAVDHLYAKETGQRLADLHTASVCPDCNGTGAQFPYGQMCHTCHGTGHTASLSTDAAWGDDPMAVGPDSTTDTYVSDGKDSLPVGVDPAKAETFDTDTLPGGDGNGGQDPKSTTTTSQAPSLTEGDSPEGDKAEGSENPLTGDTSVDKSTYDVGNTGDKMKTQGSKTAGAPDIITQLMAWENGELDEAQEAALFQSLIDSGLAWSLQGMYGRRAMDLINAGVCHAAHTGSFFNHPKANTDGPMGSQSEWDSLAAQVRQRREEDEQRKSDVDRQTTQASLFTVAQQFFAEAVPSSNGLGEGIDEGDTPEGDHAESAVQEPGQGAADKSDATDSDRPGGGVNWGTSGGAAQNQTGAYTSSLSPNAQVFVNTLKTMASLDEERAGISGHKIASYLAYDATVPASIREALRAGGNPFVSEAAEVCPGSGQQMTNVGEASTDAKFFGKRLGNCPVCGKRVSSKTSTTPRHSGGEKSEHEPKHLTHASLSTQAADLSDAELRDLVAQQTDLSAKFQKAFADLKAAGVEHDADHPAAAAYRAASDAVNHVNRKLDYYVGTGKVVGKPGEPYRVASAKQAGDDSSLLGNLPDGWSAKPGSRGTAVHTSGAKVSYDPGSGEWEAYAAASSDSEAPKSLGTYDDRGAAMGAALGSKQADVKSGPQSTCEHCGLKINRDATSTWVDHNGKTRCSKSDHGHRPNHRGRWASTTAGTTVTRRRTTMPNGIEVWEVLDDDGNVVDRYPVDPTGDTTPSPDSGNFRPVGSLSGVDPRLARVLHALEDPRSDYEKGKERGYVDSHADALDLSHPSKTEEWNSASDDWKRGWSDGYESGVNGKQSAASAVDAAESFVREAAGRNLLASIATGLSSMAAGRRDTFSLSDAKNEDGEWTMSPEQIRAEMAADQDPYDEDDFYNDGY